MTRIGPGPAGPTLAMVARAASVSIPTASKVVNGRTDVAPDTRRRVTEALDALGYVRRPRRTGAHPPPLVDLVVHSLDNTWAGTVLRGAEDAAQEAGLGVLVSAGLTRARGGGPKPGWLERLALRGTSAVLFHHAELSPSHHAWLEQHRIPYAVIDPMGPPPPGVPSVGAAHERGARGAVEHLLALGHSRIAVVGGHRRRRCGTAHMAGYRAALEAAGHPPRPEYVRYAGFDTATARAQVRELFDLPQPPTAVFACSDPMALGVYQALAERGLRVPEDVSVVGFDDLREAQWATPALTTVRLPLREMAATALRQLLLAREREGVADGNVGGARSAGGPRDAGDAGDAGGAGDGVPSAARVELPTRLVERCSTAPPRTTSI